MRWAKLLTRRLDSIGKDCHRYVARGRDSHVVLKVAQSFLVVLDGQFFDWLWETERGFSASVTDRAISRETLFEHLQQHWIVLVDVIIHPDLGLAGAMSVKSAAVLNQRAFPGDGHGSLAIPSRHSASEHDEMADEAVEAIGQILQMVLSFGEQDGRTAFLDGSDDIVHDARVSCGVTGKVGVKILNAIFGAIRLLKFRFADNELVNERSLRGLGLGVNLEADWP